tara:strand:+ start:1974 stop:2801 length:828 start_codon:yes stop_codon:yes gene_type:complete
MADDGLDKTVEEIIAGYRKYHHATGKKFKDRVKKFEGFFDEDNIDSNTIALHAQYVVQGNPEDNKSFPGAYQVAHRKLGEFAKRNGDKIEDTDQLASILESYVDTFLQHALGDKFKKIMGRAEKKAKKKEGELTKKSKVALRELKGQLMSQFYSEDGKTGKNILTDSYLKSLEGKKKVDLIGKLQQIAQGSQEMYTGWLQGKAIGDLFSEDDRYEFSEHIGDRFESAGWSHKKDHVHRTVDTQSQTYQHLLSGSADKLKKMGFKYAAPEAPAEGD